MTRLGLVVLPLAAALASWAATGMVRRYAAARLLDLPNERSSHRVPVPRGGGLALAGVFLGVVVLLGALGALERGTAAALVGGAAAVAGIGWVDDHRHVRPATRLLVHVAAALWALAWLGGLPSLDLGAVEVTLGPAGWLLGVAGIVWAINLYNFMDGIDGLAGGQAVTVGVAAGVLLLLAGGPSGLAAVTLALAGCALGFLAWNWSPAKIFMGDVGSGALGYCFAVLAIASERAGALPVAAWAILMGAFVADATITLVRRLLRRERVYEAHRDHAYQRAVRSGLTHASTTSAVLLVNAALALIAAAGAARPSLLPAALGVAALLLGTLYALTPGSASAGTAGSPRGERSGAG
jgi:Fuc2NAc and GlcNAc transferase